MSVQLRQSVIRETDTLREIVLSHPQTLRVLIERGVPVSCAPGTVADAARACDLAPAALIAELSRVVAGDLLAQRGARRRAS